MLAYLIGAYTTKAMDCTFGKGKYPKQPIGLFSDEKESEGNDVEIHEKQAVSEMELFASVLKSQGLKESGYRK